ncbi:MAG: glycosyltransferase [Acidimicrobiales bacterium]|nr:glycosyltransferase [Acidimicrobiales bacterium]|tara:strand:- start:4965 stop:6182 length:1218 start_codon:yes stop_codon:yes gene_type:complete
MRKLAVLSMHTSPLAQPGIGDGGGMNVYVREVSSALEEAGISSTVFTRRVDKETPKVMAFGNGLKVVQIDAGDFSLRKEELFSVVEDFTNGVEEFLITEDQHDALLANYWLSGSAAHQLKHNLNMPLITSFHTLARVKAASGDKSFGYEERIKVESEVIGCSDVILSNSSFETDQLVSHYGADPSRIEIVPPGVDHSIFNPACKSEARRLLNLSEQKTLLFVGRIQPLKGVDLAISTLAELEDKDARLILIGSSSGMEGPSEQRRITKMVKELGLTNRVLFVEPQPHEKLVNWYRAADVLLMPSRSESFGLVALEAAACGLPVVASEVGGLQTIVENGLSGYLINDRDPWSYAAHVSKIIDDSGKAEEMSEEAVERSKSFTWSVTAARIRRICLDLQSRSLVDCA